MSAIVSQPHLHEKSGSEEKFITLHAVSWERFKHLEQILGNLSAVRLSYAEGVLEIVSPVSSYHEEIKGTLALLLETYLREKYIRFYRRGSFTQLVEGHSSGEPDESYCIGSNKEVPDIVVEVVITSGSLDKRLIYLPKRIPEVWFWQKKKITIYRLEGEGEQAHYQAMESSLLLPDLDIAMLERYVTQPDQYDAVQGFLAGLRARR